MRHTAPCKWFHPEKGYGFLLVDGQDAFVHARDLEPGLILDEGVVVEFDLVQGPRGLRARNVGRVKVGDAP